MTMPALYIMQSLVIRARHNFKIFWTIVTSVFILMMNNFALPEFPTKDFFGNQAVNKRFFSINSFTSVSSGRQFNTTEANDGGLRLCSRYAFLMNNPSNSPWRIVYKFRNLWRGHSREIQSFDSRPFLFTISMLAGSAHMAIV